MYKNKKALLLAGLLAGPVWSQEEAALDPRAELAEYVRYAEQHNPKLKQALARYKAALAKVAPGERLGRSPPDLRLFRAPGRDAHRPAGNAL